MVKLPIPSDWDGKTWDCVRVQWPDSPQFWALLAGLLTELTRGRFWDERTGSILDAQTIGYAIDERNLPFNPCVNDGSELPEVDDNYLVQYALGGDCADCEDDMPCCGINPDIFSLDSEGNLWVINLCGKWEKIGYKDGAPNEVVVIGDLVPPDENTFYPCGMAQAVADVVLDIAGYIWDESDNTIPFLLVSQTEHHVGINLNDGWTFNAILQALIMKGSVVITGGVVVDLERSDVIPSGLSDTLVCSLAPLMGADGTADGAEIRQAIIDIIRGEFPYSQSGNNIYIQTYYTMIADALGADDLEAVAVSGALTVIEDCECPEYVPPPTASGVTSNGWYLSPERILINYPVPHDDNGAYPYDTFGYPFDKWTAEHDVYGAVFEVRADGPVTTLKRSNDDATAPVGTYDTFMSNNNSDNLSLDTKYYQMAASVYAEINSELGLSGTNLSDGGGKFSSSIPAPTADKNEVVVMCCSLHEGASPTTAKIYVRWLHNVNGPNG